VRQTEWQHDEIDIVSVEIDKIKRVVGALELSRRGQSPRPQCHRATRVADAGTGAVSGAHLADVDFSRKKTQIICSIKQLLVLSPSGARNECFQGAW
jgi:hypothetical protein